MPKGSKILVVDDEETVLDLLSYLLTLNGYKVLTASEGIAAVNLILHEKPDLILLDVMMPGYSGFSVYNEIIMAQKVPFIFVTALTIKKVREVLPSINESLVFTKPWDDKKLLETIEKVIAGSKTLLR